MNVTGMNLAGAARLENDRIRLSAMPAIGVSLTSFECRGFSKKDPSVWLALSPKADLPLKSSSVASSFIMAPYSNRIRDAQYRFEGQIFQLKNPEKHAIHGDVRNRPWQVLEKTDRYLRCQLDSREFSDFNFPCPAIYETELNLSPNGFSQSVRILNVGQEAMPVGGGFHPYFNKCLGSSDELAQLQFNVSGVYPTDCNIAGAGNVPLPSGGAVPSNQDYSQLGPLPLGLDHCFAGWTGQGQIVWAAHALALTITASSNCQHLIVYTPKESPSFAFEPATHCIDCFNMHASGLSDTGMRVLQPNQEIEFSWCVEIGSMDF